MKNPYNNLVTEPEENIEEAYIDKRIILNGY
jgi:hypothetical protein